MSVDLGNASRLNNLSIEELLREIRWHRWTLHVFGRDAPELYVAMKDVGHDRTDVFILWSEQHAAAYRAVRWPETGVLAPEFVEWQYNGTPDWTVRTVLTLAPPGTPGAPEAVERAHRLCAVPQQLRREYKSRQLGQIQSPDWTWF
jgi:hypothetical protein